MKSGVFIKGFSEFIAARSNNSSLPDIGTADNPYQLYQIAGKQGFDSFASFFNAWKKGFTDAVIFNIAADKGFETFSDYQQAQKAGFQNAEDLKLARELKVRD